MTTATIEPATADLFKRVSDQAAKRGERVTGAALSRGHWQFTFGPVDRRRKVEPEPVNRGSTPVQPVVNPTFKRGGVPRPRPVQGTLL